MRRRNILGTPFPSHAIEGEWTRLRSKPPRQYRQIVTISAQLVDTIEIFRISPFIPVARHFLRFRAAGKDSPQPSSHTNPNAP